MSKLNNDCECDWTFESAYKELEEAVARLEAGGLTLDQSIEVYEWARELVAWCQNKLDETELRVKQLAESGDITSL